MLEENNLTENQPGGQKDAGDEKSIRDVDISEYQDLSGLSTFKLNLGLWWIKNRQKFKTALIVFLIAVSAISWSYSIYGFAYYIFKGMEEDEKMILEMTRLNSVAHDYLIKTSPQNLRLSAVKSLKTGSRYDFFVQIENPNFRYWASFNYCFLTNKGNLDCGESFIMPGDSKYIMSLGKEIKASPQSVGFSITKLSWSRISLHKFPDWEKFRDAHLNIKTEGVKFTSASQSGLSERINLGSLEFELFNDTPYNYWEAALDIIIYSNNNIVGVNQYKAMQLKAGEKRKIKMSWPGFLSHVNKVEINPEINILDPGVYMEYHAGPGSIK